MFELSEPGKIELLMSDAGFTNIQRNPIASAWRARRAEDIVELLNYGNRMFASALWKNSSKRSDRMRGVRSSR